MEDAFFSSGWYLERQVEKTYADTAGYQYNYKYILQLINSKSYWIDLSFAVQNGGKLHTIVSNAISSMKIDFDIFHWSAYFGGDCRVFGDKP